MRCSNFVYRTDYRRSGFDNRLFREAAFRLSKRKVSGVWNPKRRFRMARNAVYDRFDSRTVRTNFARQTNLLPEYELPDVDNRDLLLLIQLAVEKMPGQRQRIFRMSREEGIANDEIARRLGISTRTVENQISRALSELRKLVTLILFFF